MTQPIHTIAEEEPRYPCWIWSNAKKHARWLDCQMEVYGQHELVAKGFRFWTAHSAERPTVDPTTPTPAGEKAPATQVTTSEKGVGSRSMTNEEKQATHEFLLSKFKEPEEVTKLRAERDTLAQQLEEANHIFGKVGLLAHDLTGVSDNASTADCLAKIRSFADGWRSQIASLKKEIAAYRSATAELCGWSHLWDDESGTEWWRNEEGITRDNIEELNIAPDEIYGCLTAWKECRSKLTAAQSRIAELEAQLSAKKDLGNDADRDGEPSASEVRGLYVILESQIQIQEHVREHLRQIVELANVNPATRSILRSIGNALNNSIQFARETLKSSQQQGAEKLSDVVSQPPNPPPSDQQGPSAEEMLAWIERRGVDVSYDPGEAPVGHETGYGPDAGMPPSWLIVSDGNISRELTLRDCIRDAMKAKGGT